MKKRIYLAGSFSDQSNWRELFRSKLKEKFGENVIGIHPFERKLDENNPRTKIGHDLFCIKNSDIFLVNAIKSKITIGTAQEIILAKYWNKPVIIVADEEAEIKFKKRISKTGILMKNYVHPFAFNFSDCIVESYDEALICIEKFIRNENSIKSFEDTLLPGKEYEIEILPSDEVTQKFFK